MDLKNLLKRFENCPCGRKHSFDLETYVAREGLVNEVGDELLKANFPKKIYIVSDENELKAANGILESLDKCGYKYELKVYPDLKYAYMDDSLEIADKISNFDGLLSIGTGSCNDICRYAAYIANKPFAIFATAPSMDGFASDSAPLIKNNFKISYQCRQPSIVLADTNILASSPSELKAAGFGDIVAKYVGLVDWKLSNYITGEYICENVVNLVQETVDKVVSNVEKIQSNDPKASESILDALIITGCAMQLVHLSRPASGAEHIVSHFWEIHKLEKGIWPDYHGKKVGIATCLLVPIYKEIAKIEKAELVQENLKLDDVLKHYSINNRKEIIGLNVPSIMDTVSRQAFEDNWDNIKNDIHKYLPDTDKFISLMKTAGCATTIEEGNISQEFCDEAIKYSPYMRRRITLMRILPMIKEKR